MVVLSIIWMHPKDLDANEISSARTLSRALLVTTEDAESASIDLASTFSSAKALAAIVFAFQGQSMFLVGATMF